MRGPLDHRVVMLAAASVVLAGCGGDVAVRSDDRAGPVVSPAVVDAFDVRVGDCFQGSELSSTDDIEEVFDVDAVPCDVPHDNEVYAIFELPDGDFPGNDELVRLSNEGCLQRFADFVGAEYETSRLDVFSLFPSQTSWEDGDREVVCAVFDPAGPVEGSVAGARDEYALVLPDIGDCIDDAGTPVDCATEHFAEVYLITDLEGGDAYPGDSQVEDEAAELCLSAFADYVGSSYEDSSLDFVFVNPDETTWAAGDREVSCAIFDPAGSLTGSVRGSGR